MLEFFLRSMEAGFIGTMGFIVAAIGFLIGTLPAVAILAVAIIAVSKTYEWITHKE